MYTLFLLIWADHAVIIWEEREGGFKSLATPERNEQGFLDTNVANSAAAGAGKIIYSISKRISQFHSLLNIYSLSY